MFLTSLQGQSQPAFDSPSGSPAALQSTFGCYGSVKKVGRPLVRLTDCLREDVRRKCVPKLGPAAGTWQTGINARACIATRQWKSGFSALHSCTNCTEQTQSMMNRLERGGRVFSLVPRGAAFSPLSASCQAEGDWSQGWGRVGGTWFPWRRGRWGGGPP